MQVAYKMDPEVLARVCREVLDVPLESGERFTALIAGLSAAYPDLIANEQRRWSGTKAGGILGKISFLYFGLSEYLLIFGSPAETDGFTGRYHHVDVYKVILAGRYVTYDLDSEQIAPTVYLPGDVSHMERGRARGLQIDGGSWHLEYGRGRTFTTIPFGLIDTFLSLDFTPLRVSTSEMVKMTARRLRRPGSGQSREPLEVRPADGGRDSTAQR